MGHSMSKHVSIFLKLCKINDPVGTWKYLKLKLWLGNRSNVVA